MNPPDLRYQQNTASDATKDTARVPTRTASDVLPLGRYLALVSCLVAAGFVLHLVLLDPTSIWAGDDSQYVMHARNLVAGQPYADTGYLQNPERFIGPTTYPPGFPLLLAPVVAVAGVSRTAIVAFSTVCLFGAIWLMVWLVYGKLSLVSVLSLVVLLGLNPLLWWSQNRPLSELPFLLFVVLALVLADRSERTAHRRGALVWAALAGLTAGYAILIRQLGIVLIPALVLPTLFRTRRVSLPVVILVGMGILVPLVTYAGFDWDSGARIVASGVEAETGYGQLVRSGLIAEAAEIPGRVLARLRDYALDAQTLWPLVTSIRAVHYPLRFLALGVLLLGFLVRVRRRFEPLDAFVVLYFAALLPWSFGSSRYLLPLVPFCYMYLLVGLDWLWARSRGRSRSVRGAVAGVTSLCVLLLGAHVFEGVRDAATPDDQLGPERALALVRERTAPTAVVLTSEDPRLLVLVTGRVGTTSPRTLAEWPEYVERAGVTNAYITEDREAVARFAAVEGWQRLGTTAYGDLYETRSPAGPTQRKGEAP